MFNLMLIFYLIQTNCSVLLKLVELKFFNEKILPAMERSLLRNPEVAVPGMYLKIHVPYIYVP